MEQKKDFSIINCIATAMLAYFFTIPFHESIHAVTYLIYGDKIVNFTAGSVKVAGIIDFTKLSPFHRIMSSGSASIFNAVIGIILFIILIKVKDMPSMLRLFLTQLMGGQLLEGFGYFLIGAFSVGDWGNVFSLFSDNPGTVTAMRIILGVIGAASAVVILYIATYMTYYFVEDPSNKSERKAVSLRINLTLFLISYIVGGLATMNLPLVRSGEMSYWMFLFFNSMWFIYLVAFFYAWHGIMVKPPKETRLRCNLPKEPHPAIWILALILIIIDIFVFGPGIFFS